MTREEMIKIKWKPYMSIEYKDHGMNHTAECLLSAIDFDAEVLTLTPLDDFYELREFQANLQFCSLSKRLKPSSINGHKVEDRKTNEMMAKKIGIYIKDGEDYNEAS